MRFGKYPIFIIRQSNDSKGKLRIKKLRYLDLVINVMGYVIMLIQTYRMESLASY